MEPRQVEGGVANVPTADLIFLTPKKGELSKIVMFCTIFCGIKSLVHVYVTVSEKIWHSVQITLPHFKCTGRPN